MNVENQVCSLEAAKILVEEFGITGPSLFGYVNGEVIFNPLHCDYPAFTSAELGIMLPVASGHYYAQTADGTFILSNKLGEFITNNQRLYIGDLYSSNPMPTEAEAKAMLLIAHLREGKFLNSETALKQLTK